MDISTIYQEFQRMQGKNTVSELDQLKAQLASKSLSWEETKKLRKQIEAIEKLNKKKTLPPPQPTLL